MPRLPLADIAHRAVTYSLAALTAYGVVMSVLVHQDTMKRGREIILEREAQGLPTTPPPKAQIKPEDIEQSLAEQAQAIFQRRATSERGLTDRN